MHLKSSALTLQLSVSIGIAPEIGMDFVHFIAKIEALPTFAKSTGIPNFSSLQAISYLLL